MGKVARYLLALASVLGLALALSPFQGSINSTTIALAFLIVVLIVATVFGTRAAYLASLLAVLLFNFFFLQPLYTLTISDPQNWVALVAFLATSIIAGQLSSYARRRAAESEERRIEIELLYNELTNAFEKASQAEALRQSEQLKSALLDAVTHDLRSPLTSIKASVTTLIERFKSEPGSDGFVLGVEEQKELLGLINDETDRLNNFIGGIVDLARIKAGNAVSRKSWADVGVLVEASIERCRSRLKDNILDVQIENELPSVHIASEAVSEVIYLFLDNAAKYSPAESTIRISASKSTGDMIQISVQDQGSGVELAERARIFEKFYRATREDIHNTDSGLGVGLAIAKGAAESQGGTVWVEDGEGEFTTKFVFQFPVGDEEH